MLTLLVKFWFVKRKCIWATYPWTICSILMICSGVFISPLAFSEVSEAPTVIWQGFDDALFRQAENKVNDDMRREYTCQEFRNKIMTCEEYSCQSPMLNPDYMSYWQISGKKNGRCEVSETRKLLNEPEKKGKDELLYEPVPWTSICEYDRNQADLLANEVESIPHGKWPYPFIINSIGINCRECRLDPHTKQKTCAVMERSQTL